MNTKIKKNLGVMLAITIVMLLVSFILIRINANEYTKMLDSLQDSNMTVEQYMYGGAFITAVAVFIALIGATFVVIAFPLLVTAVILLPFFPIVLAMKKERSQSAVTLIVFFILVKFTLISLLSISALIYSFWFIGNASPTPVFSYVIVAALGLAGICLIACTITSLVSYLRLRKYCKKQEKERTVNQQQILLPN